MSVFMKLAAARWKKEYEGLSPENKGWIDKNIRAEGAVNPDATRVQKGRLRKQERQFLRTKGLSQADYLRQIGEADRKSQAARGTFQRGAREGVHAVNKAYKESGNSLDGARKLLESAKATLGEPPVSSAAMPRSIINRRAALALGIAAGGMAGGGYAAYKHLKKRSGVK